MVRCFFFAWLYTFASLAFTQTVENSLGRDHRLSVKRRKEVLQWRDQLIRPLAAPVYLYETPVFSRDSSDLQPLYRYILVDPELWYGFEDLWETSSAEIMEHRKIRDIAWEFLVGNFGESYNERFIQPQLAKAKEWLKLKKAPYSHILLQVPVQVHGSEKDSLLSEYIHPQSYSGALNIPDSTFTRLFGMSQGSYDSMQAYTVCRSVQRNYLAQFIVADKLEFDFMNIDSLVASGRLEIDFTAKNIPKALLKIIHERFEELKGFVPEVDRGRIADADLLIGHPGLNFNSDRLWMRNLGGDVYISPLLIRAQLISSLMMWEYGISLMDTDKKGLVRFICNPELGDDGCEERRHGSGSRMDFFEDIEVDLIHQAVINDIRTAFDFVVLHEFAHIYRETLDEQRCDCEALKVLKTFSEGDDLGIFTNLLMVSGLKYWQLQTGREAYRPLVERSDILNRLQNSGSFTCN